jgi:plastocyanin
MVRWRLAAISGGAFFALVLAGSVHAASASVKMTEASERYAFTPATVFVHVGDGVAWTNTTDAPHTVTSDSGSELDSSTLNEDATFNHTFNTAGTFAYHCTVHGYMHGTVEVLAAGAALPATNTAPVKTAPSAPISATTLSAVAFAFGLLLFGLFIRRRRELRALS